MKYKVTYHYAALVSVEVEAKNEKEAEQAGLAEADEGINTALTLTDTWVRPIED